MDMSWSQPFSRHSNVFDHTLGKSMLVRRTLGNNRSAFENPGWGSFGASAAASREYVVGDARHNHGNEPEALVGVIDATEASGIVGTKLTPPRLHRDHVARPRLVERLKIGSDRALLLVRAPAGSGKSTILREWLDSTSLVSGWVSLDERDNDLEVFLGYVLAAVRGLFPDANLATRGLIRALTLPPLDALASSLNDDFARLPDDFVLVLDDYHLISNPDIHQLMEHLVRHSPACMHLAIATRDDPPWPLARLRARGAMTELRYDDLLFSEEESIAFLRRALGDAVDHDLAVVLHEESEGWAAGLQLMALTLKGRSLENVRSARARIAAEDIEAFLLEEVFARQPAPMQERLLEISMLNRFSAPLCEAVCELHSADEVDAGWGEAFLQELRHANLFVIPIDAGHEFFRFHHLFQQFLLSRLHERHQPEDVAQIHLRASRWFEERGAIEEALHHALAANGTHEAADIVARHRHELYNQEQFARLTRWLRLLPPEAKEHHPEILLAEARVATMNWRFVEAAVFLDHAALALESAPRDPQTAAIAQAELFALRGILDFWNGDAERVIEESRFVLETLPPEASHLRGLAHTGIASSLYQLGNPELGLAYIETQLASLSPQNPSYAWLLQTQAFLYWLQGDWTNLRLAAVRLLRVSEEIELADQEALAHYFLGAVHYARNDLSSAEAHLSRAVAARYIMRLMWWTQAAGLLALTIQALGRANDAQQIVDDMQAFVLERHAMRLLPGIGAFQAELDRRQGHHAAAVTWARQVAPGPLTWALSAIEPRIAQVRAFLAAGDAVALDQAATTLADLRAFCSRLPNRRLCCKVDLLEALLALCRGQHDSALSTVRRVVRNTEPDRWPRLFVDMGDQMQHLLRQLAAEDGISSALDQILAEFPAPTPMNSDVDQSRLIEPLSPRELEILTLLNARDSNKEIADRLFIAPGTVKRHTISIYRKLDVNGRREAVVRAAQLGILPPG